MADIRSESGIDEGYFPVGDVALPKLYIPPAVTHRKIVRKIFLVVQEVVLYRVGLVSETQDKVLVAEMRVILHDVPQDRSVSDFHERLGNILGKLSQSRSQTATE